MLKDQSKERMMQEEKQQRFFSVENGIFRKRLHFLWAINNSGGELVL